VRSFKINIKEERRQRIKRIIKKPAFSPPYGGVVRLLMMAIG